MLEPVADARSYALWSSCEGATEAWHPLRARELPGYDPRVRSRSFLPEQWQAALDGARAQATSQAADEVGRRLGPVLAQLGAVVAACEAMRSGELTDLDELQARTSWSRRRC